MLIAIALCASVCVSEYAYANCIHGFICIFTVRMACKYMKSARKIITCIL